jgi:hypothetical protein
MTEDMKLRQWLIYHDVSGELIHISGVSTHRLFLNRISVFSIKTLQRGHARVQSTVAQLVKSTRKFIVVFTKAGDSSMFHTYISSYPLYRRLGRPQGRSGRVLKISPPPGFDHRTVQLVASRYTDWATDNHMKHIYIYIHTVGPRFNGQNIWRV